MINNPRKFAITWLLDPTVKTKEYTYEYVFKFITYDTGYTSLPTGEELEVLNIDNLYNTYGYSHRYHISKFVTPQAKLYRINPYNNSKEYLGQIEYFHVTTGTLEKSSYDYKTDQSEESTQYILHLSPVSFVQSCPYYAKSRVIDETYSQTQNIDTGALKSERFEIHNYPPEAFTADFLHFSEKTTINHFKQTIKINNISTPAWEATYRYENKNESGSISGDGIYYAEAEADHGYYEFYHGIEIAGYKDYNIYQDLFNKYTDTSSNIPTRLVKCSDGLDYETFVELCEITSNFNKNTTIIFKHD